MSPADKFMRKTQGFLSLKLPNRDPLQGSPLIQIAVAFCLAMATAVISGATASAEINREANSGTFLPSSRLDSRGVQRAQELIANGEFSQSIRFLDEILARSEDSFFAGPQGEYRGLKETARQILKELPEEGTSIYQTTFGPVAKRLLKRSTQLGEDALLREIAQRYFYTPAGHEAALLYAQSEADQGRHLTAALTYEQLLETPEAAKRFQPQLSLLAATSWLAADNSDRARQALEVLSKQGYRSVQLSGEDYPLQPSRHGLVQWLTESVGTPVENSVVGEQQWMTSRGNPSRNGRTDGGLPHLRVRWRVKLLEHHNLEAVHDEMEGLLERQQKARLPAAGPLAVGDYVITRSAHGLVAIDFTTGKRVWRSQPQRASLLQNLMDGTRDQNENDVEPAQSFAQTVWEDYLYNTTSSDGKRVYVIRDLAVPLASQARAMPFIRQRLNYDQSRSTNRLCAYDLPTQGKLVWEIDGATSTDELQGAFFLGAPVTVGQSLYCLTEIKSETAIYLVALDRTSGQLQWRQQLVDLERSVNHDLKRRLQACMPSYDEGILVCPTGAGVVVGVDLAKQALAWAYQYPTQANLSPRQRLLQRQNNMPKQYWVHSSPVIAEGRILLTPPESNELHCLDLRSGKLLWKQPRGEALFLAGVEQGNVLLVGQRQVSALQLDDGESAWEKPAWDADAYEFPLGSSAAGTGFFADGQYFLPLSNAQVIAIDVETGGLTAKTSSREGQVLGNLVCYQGTVISQTGRHLDCFDQVEVLRQNSEQRLKEDATDFEALRTLGEIAYNDGDLSRALELLIQAYESSPDDLRTREVLSEAAVSALDENFAVHRQLLPLLTEIQEPSLTAQLTLMRLQAQGLQELGQAAEAFAVCLDAYQLSLPSELDLSIGREHEVDSDRWLSAQAAAAWQTADDDQRLQISEQIQPLLTTALESVDLADKQRFYDCFKSIESSDTVGLQIARELLENSQPLVAQQLLLTLVDSTDVEVQREAVALCSRILHEAEMPLLAWQFDQRLRTEFAEVECYDGKNGKQCLAVWADGPESKPKSWPYGQVEVRLDETKPTRGSSASRIPQTGIPLDRCDGVLGGCNVTLVGMVSGRNRAITIRDSLGRNFFSAKVDQRPRTIINAQASVHGVSRGNLLVLSLGRQIVAFDTFARGSQPLWRKETASNLHYVNQRRISLRGNVRNHGLTHPGRGTNGTGVIGPVTEDSCIFQVEERLVCVDSLTGQTKWTRDNIPLGCLLYGDRHHVFVVPKDSKEAMVLSTVDGRTIRDASTRVPAWQERIATVDGQIVRWHRRVDRRWQLSALDTLSGEVLWKHEFERNSRIDVAQNRFAAVADPTGHCAVVDIHTGELVVDQPIERNSSLNEVHLLVGRDSMLVAVQEPAKVDPDRRHIGGFNTGDFTKPFAGQLYLFDRESGKPRWNRPAEVEGLPLMLAQGTDLPVIAFAGNIRHRDRQGSKHEIGIMLLEKASGRLLFYDEQLPPSAHQCSLRATDVEASEVAVEMINRQIKLKFTDKPRAPEPPAIISMYRSKDASSKGLKKIGENIWRGF